MTKLTLNNVGSLIDATTAQTTINGNNATLVTAFENTLSRDGTAPNTMGSNLDMNSFQILNLPAPTSSSSPLRLTDLESFIGTPFVTPYFSASRSSNQTIPNNTATKLQCNTELADNRGWYDNVTNFRFTPQIAGKYRITGSLGVTGTTVTELDAYIYKNGSLYSRMFIAGSSNITSLNVNNIVSFNGTTDYVEFWCLIIGTGTLNALGAATPLTTWFEGQYIGT